MSSAFQLACPPIPIVRIALIGLGQRGMKTLERYASIEGAEIRCLADLSEQRVTLAARQLAASGRKPASQLCGNDAWLKACQMPDIDLVYICTEWTSHASIAIKAMECGKHVAVEVPAATTVDECTQLVRTAEKTRRHCFMTENCCYDLFTLETLELNRQHKLGQIIHCEGAYIHNLAPRLNGNAGSDKQNGKWMEHSFYSHGGNPYPTHAIGPIAQLLGIHRTDHLTSITSVTSKGLIVNGETIGRVSNSLLQTANGVTILLQLDVTTPRPYNRLQTVCGTKGFVQKYPLPTLQLDENEALTGHDAMTAMQRYATSRAAELWMEGHRKGVANEMNYAMDARLVECLRGGLPLDIDVYDAAEWSCLAELSKLSAEQGGQPMPIPSFIA